MLLLLLLQLQRLAEGPVPRSCCLLLRLRRGRNACVQELVVPVAAVVVVAAAVAAAAAAAAAALAAAAQPLADAATARGSPVR